VKNSNALSLFYSSYQDLQRIEKIINGELKIHYDFLVELVVKITEKFLYDGRFDDALLVLDSDFIHLIENELSNENRIILRLEKAKILFNKHLFEYDNFDRLLAEMKEIEADVRVLNNKKILADYLDLYGWGLSLSLMFSDSSYDDCLKYFQEALKLREEISDMRGISDSLFHIGLVYERRRDDEEKKHAYEIYRRGYKIADEGSYKLEKSHLARHLGYYFRETGNLEKALRFFKESLALRSEIGFKIWIGSACQTVASVYARMNDYRNALKYFRSATELLEKTGYKPYLVLTLIALGDFYKANTICPEALETYRKALRIAKNINFLKAEEEISDKIENMEKYY
jgi:tetratricopeptide (TPR) repeat protein